MDLVVVLSGVPYHSTKQRPHHMASFFASKGYKVLYLSIIGQKNVLSEEDFKEMMLGELIRNHSKEVQPNLFSLDNVISTRDCNETGMKRLIKKIEGHSNAEKVTFIVAFPGWARYITDLSEETLLIYDCMDEWESFVSDLNWGYRERLVQDERKLAGIADLVLTSARSLYMKMVPLNNQVIYMPNGVKNSDYYSFSTDSEVPCDVKEIDQPIIFFMGAIAGWVDLNLIEYLSDSRPHYSFVFVGSEVKEKLPKKAHIHFLGHKEYDDLPAYLSQSRVAIIPFKVNTLTTAVTPLKFYEYLSSGTPVVTTMMPDIIGVSGSKIALNKRQFLNYIDHYVVMDEIQYRKECLKAVQSSHKFEWETIFSSLLEYMEGNLNITSVNSFIDQTITMYQNLPESELIKNELVTLYNLKENYESSYNLFELNEVIEQSTSLNYNQLALAAFKSGHIEEAVELLKIQRNRSSLFCTYIDSILKDRNKEILLEILLYKYCGRHYEALSIVDKNYSMCGINPKFLGIISGIYLDIGDRNRALDFAIESLNFKENLHLTSIFDLSLISYLIEHFMCEENYEFAKEVAFSIYNIDSEWEEKSIEFLSDIHLTENSGGFE